VSQRAEQSGAFKDFVRRAALDYSFERIFANSVSCVLAQLRIRVRLPYQLSVGEAKLPLQCVR
jgi:hypothetical protein